MPFIICEEEKQKEEMASNLRVEFHERQHKHRSESIAINLSPSKKAYPKPAPNPPSKSAPWTTIVAVISEMDEKPSFVDDISYQKQGNLLSS